MVSASLIVSQIIYNKKRQMCCVGQHSERFKIFVKLKINFCFIIVNQSSKFL